MRRTIKKSQLKNLVESVINELDWKTYMNAAKISGDDYKYNDDEDAAAKGKRRGPEFLKAARDSYAKKYDGAVGRDRDNSVHAMSGKKMGGGNVKYNNVRVYGDSEYDDNDEPISTDTTETTFGWDNSEEGPYIASKHGKVYDGDVFDYVRDGYRGEPNDSTPMAYDDAYNYENGKSEYEKGKGWTDESRRRFVNRITESVVRKLRRV